MSEYSILAVLFGIRLVVATLWHQDLYEQFNDNAIKHLLCRQTAGWNNCFQYGGRSTGIDDATQKCRALEGVVAVPFNSREFDALCTWGRRNQDHIEVVPEAEVIARNIFINLGATDTHINDTFYDNEFNRIVAVAPEAFYVHQPNDRRQQCLAVGIGTTNCFLLDYTCSKATENICSFPMSKRCEYNNGGCHNSLCVVNEGHTSCLCNFGYSHTTDNADNVICIDIDECVDIGGANNTCKGCVNTASTYGCYCDNGYENQDGKCVYTTYNECDDLRLNNCTEKCINKEDAHHCKCYYGIDDDESCAEKEAQKEDPLSHNSIYVVIAVLSVLGSLTAVIGVTAYIVKDLRGKDEIMEIKKPTDEEDHDANQPGEDQVGEEEEERTGSRVSGAEGSKVRFEETENP